jgi:hypothetical protein
MSKLQEAANKFRQATIDYEAARDQLGKLREKAYEQEDLVEKLKMQRTTAQRELLEATSEM